MEEGRVQEEQKAVWCRRKADVGVFSSPQVASTFLAQEVKKEYLFCREVDLIFKSADRNITHMFQAKDIPPWSILQSLLPRATSPKLHR